MKKLIIALFILPLMLFAGGPSCFEGMEVSLIDANGAVIKSGKLDYKGKIFLVGVGDVAFDVKLTNKGKSVTLEVNKSSGGIDKSTPIMYKATPLMYNKKLSEVKGGGELLKSAHEAAHVVQQKGGLGGEAGLDETNSSERADANINTSRSNIKQQNRKGNNGDGTEDCDDANIIVTAKGNGKVEIQVTGTK